METPIGKIRSAYSDVLSKWGHFYSIETLNESKLHKEDAKFAAPWHVPFNSYNLLYLGGRPPYAATRNKDGTVRADIVIRLCTGVSNPFSTLLEKRFPLQGERGHSSNFWRFKKQNRGGDRIKTTGLSIYPRL